jgi:hypothetical protein
MLVGMDIPAAAAGPWIVLGVVLGVLLVGLAGLLGYLVLRGGGSTIHSAVADRAPAPGTADDDLPGFLESPPGSPAAPAPPATGWAVLTAAPAPAAPGVAPPSGSDTVRVLAVLTMAAVLLIGVAAGLAVVSSSQHAATPPTRGQSADRLDAHLTFGGVILERRAVGVTATYPRMQLTAEGERTVAHLELPTANCLTAEAPDDPVAARCTPAGTEYADLATPALVVRRQGGAVRISGRFETYLRPNGTPPVSTGRVYELELTVESVGDARPGSWVPATGVLHLGDDRAATTGGPDDQLRFGG